MFLTTHTSAALLIATKITNPVLGFVLGFISHFVLDFIPHGDTSLFRQSNKTHQQRMWIMFRSGLIDFILATAFLILFLWQYQPSNYSVFIATAIGSWLPDFAWGAIEFFKIKSLDWFCRFHHQVHDVLDITYPIVYGLLFQALFIILMMLLIFTEVF